jgi:DNA-binding MarR family transcriptional regulator
MTAGRLSELTGLSSGATTRLIDRLEASGYVRRMRDPSDRRRVIIEPIAEKGPEVFALFAPMGQRIRALWETFDPEQIQLLVEYLRKSNAIMAEENARIRREAEEAQARREGAAAS